MNSERSSRRAWVREVAMGLGRKLTRAEERTVDAAWRRYQRSVRALHFTCDFPADLVKRFAAADRGSR